MISIEDLEKMRDEKDVSGLIKALDEDDRIKEKAAYILGDIKSEESVDSLIACLNDDYWPVRKAATLSLGRIGDKKAVNPLLDC